MKHVVSSVFPWKRCLLVDFFLKRHGSVCVCVSVCVGNGGVGIDRVSTLQTTSQRISEYAYKYSYACMQLLLSTGSRFESASDRDQAVP